MVLVMVLLVDAQQDQKAKDILDKVSAKTGTFKTISADFAFTMQNKEMEINEVTEGTIKLKGQKYYVDLPNVNNGVEVYSNGVTIWNYMKEGNQVTISNIDEENNELMDPSTLFSIYEKGFDSKFIAEKKIGNTIVYQLELYPDSDEFDVSKISISIDKTSMMIHSAVLNSTDGNLYGIEVKKIETDKDFADSVFEFDSNKYPDIEIIDFR